MTKTVFSTAVWFTVFSIILKMVVFLTGQQFTDFDLYLGLGYVFLLMTAIFITIRNHKLKVGGTSSFVDDIKAGMKVTALYAILMSAFLYAYYTLIDPDYFTIMLQQKVAEAEVAGNTNIEEVKKAGEFVLSPYFQSTVSLVIFMIVGVFYSSLITFFVRKMRGFGH